jgi:hypothetical protein
MELPSHVMILLPMKLMNEVKGLGHGDASWIEEMTDRYLGKYSGIGTFGPELMSAVRSDMARLSNSNVPALIREMSSSLRELFGDSGAWNNVSLHAQGTEVVARTMGLIGGGDELAHDERWTQLT